MPEILIGFAQVLTSINTTMNKYMLVAPMAWGQTWVGNWFETNAPDARYGFDMQRQSEELLSNAESAAGLIPAADAAAEGNVLSVKLPPGNEGQSGAAEILLPQRSYWRGSFQYFVSANAKKRVFSDQCILEIVAPGSAGANIYAGVVAAIGALSSEALCATILRVVGRGRNQIGSYSLVGTFDASNQQLELQRIYDPKGHQQKFPPIKPRNKQSLGEAGATPGVALESGGLAAAEGDGSGATGAGRRSSGRTLKRSRFAPGEEDEDEEEDGLQGAGGDDASVGGASAADRTGLAVSTAKKRRPADAAQGSSVGEATADGDAGTQRRKQGRGRLMSSIVAGPEGAPGVSSHAGGAGSASDAAPGHGTGGTGVGSRAKQPIGAAAKGAGGTSRVAPVWRAAHVMSGDGGAGGSLDGGASGGGIDVYEGEMAAGLPEGTGTAVYRNGLMYEGGWAGGREHGWGVLTDGDDLILYQGDFAEGTLHGQGSFSFGNGDRYVGGWREGLCHGVGTYTAASGASYDGEWSEGHRHGQGVLVLADGSVYSGGWRHGQRHGKGTLSMASGMRYRGEWAGDMPEGKGEMLYADGGRYEGGFHGGRRDGRGGYTFPDGQQLSGKWNADVIEESGECRDRAMTRATPPHTLPRTGRQLRQSHPPPPLRPSLPPHPTRACSRHASDDQGGGGVAPRVDDTRLPRGRDQSHPLKGRLQQQRDVTQTYASLFCDRYRVHS